MKFVNLILFLILIGNTSFVFAFNCENPALSFSCNYYRECLESQFSCGESGYPLGYGEKYCIKFFEKNELVSNKSLSPKGEIWRDATGKCLQEELHKKVINNGLFNCDELTKFAFATHPKCYTQKKASICDLPVNDWKIIANIPDRYDLLSKNGRTQMKIVLAICAKSILFELRNIEKNRIVKNERMITDQEIELRFKVKIINDVLNN
jgi:hypothetical protein